MVETRFMNMPAYAITRYEPLLAAFRDGERFPPERIYQMMFEPICGQTFQTMTSRDHVIRRRLATPAFRADAVRKQDENEIIALANELIDEFPSDGEVDFAEALHTSSSRSSSSPGFSGSPGIPNGSFIGGRKRSFGSPKTMRGRFRGQHGAHRISAAHRRGSPRASRATTSFQTSFRQKSTESVSPTMRFSHTCG